MIDYSTVAMVATVKRRAALPPIQPRFSDANIVAFLDEEMRNIITPLIMSIVQEHFVTSVDFMVTTSAFTFSIPSAAIGAKLTNVARLIEGTTREVTMPQLAPGDLTNPTFGYHGNSSQGYILKANKIVVQPAPTSGFTLRVYYYRRPNMLVDSTKAAQVTAIDTGTGVITASAGIPAAWTTATLLDSISSTPTFEVQFEKAAVSAVTATSVTISTTNAALLSIGDWLSETGEAVVPAQIPLEGHSLIVEAAIIKVAEGLSDTVLKKSATDSYGDLKTAFLLAITPRVDRSPKKAVSRGGNCWDWQ